MHILLLQIDFNILCEFYQHASEMLKKKKKQLKSRGNNKRTVFWVREDELCAAESYQLSSLYRAKAHRRSGFDVEAAVLHRQEGEEEDGKKKCSKNGA